MANHWVYRFHAELEGYAPSIWRRFEILGDKTMSELGYVLMTLFEMKASHLFCFLYDFGAGMMDELRDRFSEEDIKRIVDDSDIYKTWRFELPYPDYEEFLSDNEIWHDPSKYRIKSIATRPPLQFTFEYDYGDGWRVQLTLEHCEKSEVSAKWFPRVLEGKGYGIVEDCGGVGGLNELAEAFKIRKGDSYDEYRQWLGVNDFDLKAFDIDDMNFRLRKVPRIYRDIYEYGDEPSQHSIDLLERKYLK